MGAPNPAIWSQTSLPKCSSPICSSWGFLPYLWVKIGVVVWRRTPICQVVHQKKERKHKVVVTTVSYLGALSLMNVMVGRRQKKNRAKGRDSAAVLVQEVE